MRQGWPPEGNSDSELLMGLAMLMTALPTVHAIPHVVAAERVDLRQQLVVRDRVRDQRLVAVGAAHLDVLLPYQDRAHREVQVPVHLTQ